MHIRLLAMGTRGDVQPYLALALGLKAAGYTVSIGTTSDFEDFVASYGIEVQVNSVNVREFMTQAATRKEKIAARKALVQNMLDEMPTLIGDADAIIYSPAASMGAPHVAEKRGIPAIIALLQTYLHPTSDFPVIGLPALPLGGGYNRFSYSIFHSLLWQPMKKTINAWRENSLGLPPAAQNPIKGIIESDVPTLYGFSPSVVSNPADWGEHIKITGYWFLDQSADYAPPDDLAEFLAVGDPPVYIGFGSMSSKAPEETAEIVLSAIKQAGVRGIIASGWHGLSASNVPENIMVIEHAPHDWLFPKMAAVVHHGGAGTTAAGLRAGVPSILVPTRGDQPFWGKRLYELGVGTQPIPRKKLNADDLAGAIKTAVSDPQIKQKAAKLGETIRSEDGVSVAVDAVKMWLR